jgi:dsRNA-specific ribonuclease
MNFANEEDVYVEKQNGQEIYVFNPYNENNIEITKEEVETILRTYGVTAPIHNFNLYKRAFIHQSYMKKPQYENRQHNITIVECPPHCLPLSTKSNERLEYIGDGVLENITKYYLYCRFPKEEPGFLTDKKIALVKNESIGKMAFEMGLHKWLILSKHAEMKQTRYNLKKLGCLFEAFVGAIFHDFNRVLVNDADGWFKTFDTGPGFQMCQLFVRHVYEKHVDWVELVQNDDNYKNILQVKIQKEFKTTPHYMDLNEDDDDKYNMGVFLCLGQSVHGRTRAEAVHFHDFATCEEIHRHVAEHGHILLFLGEGRHTIKKKAEQLACQMALEWCAIK